MDPPAQLGTLASQGDGAPDLTCCQGLALVGAEERARLLSTLGKPGPQQIDGALVDGDYSLRSSALHALGPIDLDLGSAIRLKADAFHPQLAEFVGPQARAPEQRDHGLRLHAPARRYQAARLIGLEGVRFKRLSLVAHAVGTTESSRSRQEAHSSGEASPGFHPRGSSTFRSQPNPNLSTQVSATSLSHLEQRSLPARAGHSHSSQLIVSSLGP